MGITLSVNATSGWNPGCPFVTPERALKRLTDSETDVRGGGRVEVELPQPPTWYVCRDICVQAVRKAPEGALMKDAAIPHWSAKAFYSGLGFQEIDVYKRQVLGYPLQVVGENADPRTTINPAFELSYWRTGLRLAQQWRVRLGLPEKREYDEVLRKLSPLPVEEGVYVSWENIERMWTSYNWEHPALVGAYCMLPGDGVDIPTMRRTLAKVHAEWKLGETWGWDFPMLAMCAARLGDPERAVEYLLLSLIHI